MKSSLKIVRIRAPSFDQTLPRQGRTAYSGLPTRAREIRANTGMIHRASRKPAPVLKDSLQMENLPLAEPGVQLSIWALFMQAGWVVKLVMIGLLLASIWTWAIVVDKMFA